jgi:tetratricopeptide (TPR) repeat protein
MSGSMPTTGPDTDAPASKPAAPEAAAPATAPSGLAMHMGLAEQGKLHALAGEHSQAMIYYREAIRMATAQGAPEVFFRHYLECLIESLEHTGAWREVVVYCDRALEHLAGLTPADEEQAAFIRYDRANLEQRRGAVLYKLGMNDDARGALKTAIDLGRTGRFQLPLAETLYGWIVRGYRTDARRITAEQERFQYFSVRPETVDPAKAIRLPDTHLQALQVPGQR